MSATGVLTWRAGVAREVQVGMVPREVEGGLYSFSADKVDSKPGLWCTVVSGV